MSARICLQILSAFLVCASLPAASGADLVEQGNREFARGKFDAALELYDQAAVDAPESAEIYFNKGTVYFRKGDLARAREMFEKAGLKTRSLALEARSQYNLGNCAYKEAEKQADSDLGKCLRQMATAITHFQKALKLDPGLLDAAHNIEIVRLKMKEIMDRIKKQEEQEKKKREQQRKQMEKLKKLLKDQQKLAQDAKKLAYRKPGKSDPAKSAQAGRLADQQEKLRQQTGNFANRMHAPKNKPMPKLEQARKHLERAGAKQARAEQELRRNRPKPGAENAEQAAEAIKKAIDALSGRKKKYGGKNKQQPGKRKNSGNKPKPRKQKKKAASKPDQDARGIINQERRDRKQRQSERRAAGYVPVDKDW